MNSKNGSPPLYLGPKNFNLTSQFYSDLLTFLKSPTLKLSGTGECGSYPLLSPENKADFVINDRIDYRKLMNKLPDFISRENKYVHSYEYEMEIMSKFVKQEIKLSKEIIDNYGMYLLNEMIEDSKQQLPVEKPYQLLYSTENMLRKSDTGKFLNEIIDNNLITFYIPAHYSLPGLNSFPKMPQDTFWIFTPSFERSHCARLNYENQIFKIHYVQIIVVKPNQFMKYLEKWGRYHIIAQIPANNSGVGYSRYWCQKIAEHFGLEYIWMIDDSTCSIYNYILFWLIKLLPGRTFDIFAIDSHGNIKFLLVFSNR